MQLIKPHMKKSEVTIVKAKRLPEGFVVSDMVLVSVVSGSVTNRNVIRGKCSTTENETLGANFSDRLRNQGKSPKIALRCSILAISLE